MIVIGADFVPTVSNYDLFADGDIDALFGEELSDLLSKAEYRIFNLETPLCDLKHPIIKCGMNFSAPTSAVNAYKTIHADLLTLANNHIFDQGTEGLHSTCEILSSSQINTVGVGKDHIDAAKPFCFTANGERIGVYACADHEFSIVSDEHAGANPFDPLESFDHISSLKRHCDYVIVLYHGGKEYFRYPSPYLQRICRKMADSGADLVICQHSHCIGCEEKYENSTIVYGQGNFLFDGSDREEWKTSLLVTVENKEISYVPLVKNGRGVRLAPKSETESILEEFRKRSENIKKDGFVKENFILFSQEMINDYLLPLNGKKSFLFRVINRLTKGGYKKSYLKRKYPLRDRTKIQNCFECEAIREVVSEGIKHSASDT